MNRTTLARVDGLPAQPLTSERTQPASDEDRERGMSAKQRTRIERQTAAVHTAALPRSIDRALRFSPALAGAYPELDTEADEIRQMLSDRGVL